MLIAFRFTGLGFATGVGANVAVVALLVGAADDFLTSVVLFTEVVVLADFDETEDFAAFVSDAAAAGGAFLLSTAVVAAFFGAFATGSFGLTCFAPAAFGLATPVGLAAPAGALALAGATASAGAFSLALGAPLALVGAFVATGFEVVLAGDDLLAAALVATVLVFVALAPLAGAPVARAPELAAFAFAVDVFAGETLVVAVVAGFLAVTFVADVDFETLTFSERFPAAFLVTVAALAAVFGAAAFFDVAAALGTQAPPV